MVELRNFDWPIGGFLILYQVALLVSLPLYLVFSAQHLGIWITLPVLVMLCGIGVTSLYHRYYSHRTYSLNKALEVVLLFFGTLALQGSALKWAHDHRLHHRFVDTDKDPYSIKKGFWHAHFFWMLERRKRLDMEVVHDLKQNRLLLFQDKYYVPLLIAANLLIIGVFGWLCNDYVGAFIVLFLLRVFINHHTTWFINSLAHTWGVQPYSREHSAVNNWVISLVTYGEGYHNYHHTFAGDYRNGTRWYHFDPTKAMIWSLSKVNLTSGLRTVDRTVMTKALVLQDKKLLLQKTKSEERMLEIHTRAEAMLKRLEEVGDVVRQYKATKNRELHLKLKALKKDARLEMRQWSRFCDDVLSTPTV